MFEIFNDYLKEWRRECGGRIHVMSTLFEKRTRISIEECFDHWKIPDPLSDDVPSSDYTEADIGYRLSLIPCVRELLMELPHEPVKNEETGNWEVELRVPKERDPQSNVIQVVTVVIAYEARKGWYLKTYHPYQDTVGKKKKKSMRF